MDSITATTTNIQVLQEAYRRIHDLEQELARSEEHTRLVELRNQEYEAERDFLHRLFSNPHISPAAKLVLWAIRCFVLTLRVDHHATTDVHISGKSGLAGQVGLSTDTVGRLIKRFDKSGVLVRGERSDWVEDEDEAGKKVWQKRTIVSVALTDLADRPESITDDAPKHGGKREKRCEACGSTDLWVETKVVCRACTYENHYSIEPLNQQGEEVEQMAQVVTQGGDLVELGDNLGHDQHRTDDDLSPNDQEGTAKQAVVRPRLPMPVAAAPCHRCEELNKWAYDNASNRWVCSCYYWWYEHPEWRHPEQRPLLGGGEL